MAVVEKIKDERKQPRMRGLHVKDFPFSKTTKCQLVLTVSDGLLLIAKVGKT